MLQQLDDHLARTDLTRSLPQRAYSAPEVFELEAERVFRNEWLAVCGSEDLPEHGDYLALEVADEPVVVIRGADGELRAFANVCRHRGTLLYTEGRGRAEQVVCPYHAWSYDRAGALTAVPYPGRAEIDRASHGLLRFHLEIWRGIVFIHLGAEPDVLVERLAGLDELLDPYAFERFASSGPWGAYAWQANWKLAFENALDWYHVFHAHPTTLEPIAATRDAFLIEGSPRWSVTASRLARRVAEHSDDPPGVADFEREHYLLISIPPNLGGLCHCRIVELAPRYPKGARTVPRGWWWSQYSSPGRPHRRRDGLAGGDHAGRQGPV